MRIPPSSMKVETMIRSPSERANVKLTLVRSCCGCVSSDRLSLRISNQTVKLGSRATGQHYRTETWGDTDTGRVPFRSFALPPRPARCGSGRGRSSHLRSRVDLCARFRCALSLWLTATDGWCRRHLCGHAHDSSSGTNVDRIPGQQHNLGARCQKVSRSRSFFHLIWCLLSAVTPHTNNKTNAG